MNVNFIIKNIWAKEPWKVIWCVFVSNREKINTPTVPLLATVIVVLKNVISKGVHFQHVNQQTNSKIWSEVYKNYKKVNITLTFVWRFRKNKQSLWNTCDYYICSSAWWYKQHKKQSETIGSIIPFPIASTPPKLYQKPGWTWNRSGSLHYVIGAFFVKFIALQSLP